ncbi:DNA repair protein RecN [Biostraticola tofi]|uniref:DNA repair protein RecN n=1 Tax=Biostraticola tofi TaxID=466109 RepID=A0A4R3YL87_9GAMM|nr:DNA repair protein RecN [Biostraticola tofi]TCV92188.1 DNA replication and repair protein RecN [Biostraticola tofi]
MLAQLTIANFAIVRELIIDFQTGMSVITGETGAGKSIAIDALGLCLGSRAEASMVRPGAARADICARFALNDAPLAGQWLVENELDNGQECLLRRVVGHDGRSRGFINGTPVPLSQLRELGQFLIQIHGQHAHQMLLRPDHQKNLLDAYADEKPLLAKMAASYSQWHQSCVELASFRQHAAEREARRELLQYQLKELNEFAPVAEEYEQVDLEYKRLANSGQLISMTRQAMDMLSEGDDHNLLSLTHALKSRVTELVSLDPGLSGIMALLEEASIQLSEASDELRHYSDGIDLDPVRLSELEQRLSRHISLARKHHVRPEELHQFHQQLLAEQQLLDKHDTDSDSLSQAVERYRLEAMSVARELHDKRVEHGNELASLITRSMHELSLPHGQLAINTRFTPDQLNAEGASRVEFLVTTNPGQPLQPLAKVASGGELSRIALAIQMITARKMDTPALIFDEVDVGISGPTAATVGRMLRQLGESTQVMCVTHLPQVAGSGHHHFFVSKNTDGNVTETEMHPLDRKARLQELARLLGGSEVTRNTLANARDLLAA